MIFRVLVCLGLCLGIEALYAGEATEVSSQIKAVTVMADRAEVTRQVKAKVGKGESLVIVEGLLPKLDERTLRALGNKSVRIQGISSDEVERMVRPAVDKKELGEKLEKNQTEMEEIEAQVLGLRRQVELLRNFRGRTLNAIRVQATMPKKELPEQDLKLESWKNTIAQLSKQELGIQTKIRDLEIQRFKLQQVETEMKAQLQAHQKPELKPVRRALIGIYSEQGGEITFDLIYRIHGPSWRLRYDLRLDSKKKQIKLEAYGMVLQETGEDWSNVALTLSSRQAASGLRPPEIKPLVLAGKIYHKPKHALATVAQSVSAGDISTEAALPEQTKTDPGKEAKPNAELKKPKPLAGGQHKWSQTKGLEGLVELETSLTGHVFKIKQKHTLASSEDAHQVPILEATVPVKIRLESVPQYNSTVYRRVTAFNRSGQPLLSGKAVLFLDGDLIGNTVLKTVAPGAELALGFGRVDGLSVERLEIDKEQSPFQGDLVDLKSRKRRYHFHNRYELWNRTASKHTVVALDTIPVSEAKDVEVSINKEKTTLYEMVSEGVLGMEITTEAKGKTPLNLVYTVTLPERLK